MKFALIGSLVLIASFALAQTKAAQAGPTAAFDKLADQYFSDYYFKFNPTQGTAAGFHQYDTQLENYSKASIDEQIAVLQDQKKKFDALKAPQLSRRAAADRDLVLNDINSRLLTFQDIRTWEKNPDLIPPVSPTRFSSSWHGHSPRRSNALNRP